MPLSRVASSIVLLALAVSGAGAQQRAYDPVTADPPLDLKNPPRSVELALTSHGSRLNALLYRAGGAGRHPAVVMLHGFPGNERNLDLAQALRRAGYHVLYFNYRGSWGSAGAFSFANSREDVASALAFMRDSANATKYGIDARRVTLLGHSFGGWLALAGAADDARLTCTIALSPWNLGRYGQFLANGKFKRADAIADNRTSTDPQAGPLRTTPEALIAEAIAHATPWDFVALAKPLASKKLLVIASTEDERTTLDVVRAPLDSALKALGARGETSMAIDDDHSYDGHRLALARIVIDWLRRDCAL